MPIESPNTLIINGSPRKGNTHYICEQIQGGLDHNSEIIQVTRQNILSCRGCDTRCIQQRKPCALKDDMSVITEKIVNASCLVMGSPNYWDDITSDLARLIHRLNPLFRTGKMDHKPFLRFMVGGKPNQEFALESGFGGIVRHLDLNLIGSYYLQAHGPRELRDDPERVAAKIAEMVSKINAAVAASTSR